mmetsp:Transcript_49993/g.131804  ORF Transcript_49993/g.131804 Transcript_49993/m.131804 type:complete len:235 (-) Transcript_49993:775-1479(-)
MSKMSSSARASSSVCALAACSGLPVSTARGGGRGEGGAAPPPAPPPARPPPASSEDGRRSPWRTSLVHGMASRGTLCGTPWARPPSIAATRAFQPSIQSPGVRPGVRPGSLRRRWLALLPGAFSSGGRPATSARAGGGSTPCAGGGGDAACAAAPGTAHGRIEGESFGERRARAARARGGRSGATSALVAIASRAHATSSSGGRALSSALRRARLEASSLSGSGCIHAAREGAS